MNKIRTTLYLTPEQKAKIETEAKKLGIAEAAVIRIAVERYFDKKGE